ncbi:hypothetical protein M404DRAFT_998511 [Pisolithus tinctorius Marx 270]|uniref:Uncharacterized protein n=1 Tax=Pisolithus tinctorius Marx 270 TaxID=870435 RepID=A0A0C3P211_PISTI|nr:hypothetical protein M404DRAFT_998511 [Pisolithus tinctorius Marx 270]
MPDRSRSMGMPHMPASFVFPDFEECLQDMKTQIWNPGRISGRDDKHTASATEVNGNHCQACLMSFMHISNGSEIVILREGDRVAFNLYTLGFDTMSDEAMGGKTLAI